VQLNRGETGPELVAAAAAERKRQRDRSAKPKVAEEEEEEESEEEPSRQERDKVDYIALGFMRSRLHTLEDALSVEQQLKRFSLLDSRGMFATTHSKLESMESDNMAPTEVPLGITGHEMDQNHSTGAATLLR